jgi:hypothetical protein
MTTETSQQLSPLGKFQFSWILPFLIKPASTFPRILIKRAVWLTPLLLLSVLVIAEGIILSTRQPTVSEAIPVEAMPSGLESKSVEVMPQGEIPMEGEPAGGSPLAMLKEYIPVGIKLAGIWVSWFVLTSFIYVGMVASGGHNSFAEWLNLVSWSALPYGVQSIARIVAWLISPGLAVAPGGISSLLGSAQGSGGKILTLMLAQVTIFLVWQIVLLVVGTRQLVPVQKNKATWIMLAIVVIFLALSTLPAFGFQQLEVLTAATQPVY